MLVMSLSFALRGLLGSGHGLLGAGLLQAAAGSAVVPALQRRAASSHAENTNTFLREVRLSLWLLWRPLIAVPLMLWGMAVHGHITKDKRRKLDGGSAVVYVLLAPAIAIAGVAHTPGT